MEDGERRLRVVLADDEQGVRDALRLSLELESDFEVVGEAADGAQAVEVAAREQPDVVVLDLRMPKVDGLAALPLLRDRCPDAQLIVLSAVPEVELGHDAIAGGADGYLEKGRAMADLPSWLRMLRAGWEAGRSA